MTFTMLHYGHVFSGGYNLGIIIRAHIDNPIKCNPLFILSRASFKV